MSTFSPWSEADIAHFLDQSLIPLRLAVLDSQGGPLVASLWFLPDLPGRIWCASHESAQVIRHLTRDPRCGFEVAGDAPPYRGVRGRGQVELIPARGQEMLERLLARYQVAPESRLASNLMARADGEVAICINFNKLKYWDFSKRMKDAAMAEPRIAKIG